MVLWQYKIVGLAIDDSERKNNEQLLNSLGKQGWELVVVSDSWNRTDIIAYLKKRNE